VYNKNFPKYTDEKLKNFLWEWENVLPSRKVIDIETYVKARKEAFERWNDNSNYYIVYFLNKPKSPIEDFKIWFKEIKSICGLGDDTYE